MKAVFRLTDVAVNYFLFFFKSFFSVLGRYSPIGTEIAKYLPSSLYTAKRIYNEIQFRRYVVCRKCHKIYFFDSCIEGSGTKRSRTCCHRQFPFHPHRSMRQQCGTLLLKTIEMTSGKRFFYPFMTYCYVGLEVSMQSLVGRQNFMSDCEKWRQMHVHGGRLTS